MPNTRNLPDSLAGASKRTDARVVHPPAACHVLLARPAHVDLLLSLRGSLGPERSSAPRRAQRCARLALQGAVRRRERLAEQG